MIYMVEYWNKEEETHSHLLWAPIPEQFEYPKDILGDESV